MIQFRRAGWRLVAWLLVLFFFWTAAAGGALVFLLACFPLTSWSLEKAETLALVGTLSATGYGTALTLRSWIRAFKECSLALESQVLRVRLPGMSETGIPWTDIKGVTCKRCREMVNTTFGPFPSRIDVYTVLTANGSISFTGREIPRPGRAASKIADRAGCEVLTIHPAVENAKC